MKRIFTPTIIILTLAALMLPGCGKKEGEEGGSASDPTQSSSAPKTDAPAPETTTGGGGAPQGGGVEVKSASDPGPG